jgi:hypothetical protein
MTCLLDTLDAGDGYDLQPAAALRSTGAWRRLARRRPDPTAPRTSCTEKWGLYGKGTATNIRSKKGESTLQPGHPPPQGAKGGSTDQGYNTTSSGSQGGPRQGRGRWGGGDEHCVGTADVRRSVSLAAIWTAVRQRRRKRWKPVRGTCGGVTRDTGVRPF